MANFISPKGEYPRHIGDVQLVQPNYQYGDVLPEGWVEVVLTEIPEYDSLTQTFEELLPIEIDGVMTQQWIVKPLTEEAAE